MIKGKTQMDQERKDMADCFSLIARALTTIWAVETDDNTRKLLAEDIVPAVISCEDLSHKLTIEEGKS